MMIHGRLGSLGIDCNNPPAGMSPDEVNRLCESQAPVYASAINPESAAKVASLIAKYPCMAAGLVLSNPPWTQPDLQTIEGQIALGLFGAPGRSPCDTSILAPAPAPVAQSYEQAVASYVENKPNQSVPPSPQQGEVAVPKAPTSGRTVASVPIPEAQAAGTNWLLIGGLAAAALFVVMGMRKGRS